MKQGNADRKDDNSQVVLDRSAKKFSVRSKTGWKRRF
jgi:hypothetical protein